MFRSPRERLHRTPAPRGAILLLSLPFAIMAVLEAIDIAIGSQVLLLPLLSLAPAFMALIAGVRYTLAIGCGAFVLASLDAAYEDLNPHQVAITLATICGVTAASIAASAIRQRRERELADVHAVAQVAQQVLLRPVPSGTEAVMFAVRYVSASARAQIGGDVYEVIEAPDGLRVLLGDVQGKGLPAVKTASVILGSFREAAYDTPDLRQIADRLELSVRRQLAEEEFVSAVLAGFSADGSRLRILNCGHPPPLLVRAHGESSFIEPAEASLPLGLFPLARSGFPVTTVELSPGDRVLFYTDGVSEARNAAGEYYPLGRCSQWLAEQDLDACLRRLHDDIVTHVGHPLDDDAALLLASRGAQDRPGPAPRRLCSSAKPAAGRPAGTNREAHRHEHQHQF